MVTLRVDRRRTVVWKRDKKTRRVITSTTADLEIENILRPFVLFACSDSFAGAVLIISALIVARVFQLPTPQFVSSRNEIENSTENRIDMFNFHKQIFVLGILSLLHAAYSAAQRKSGDAVGVVIVSRITAKHCLTM